MAQKHAKPVPSAILPFPQQLTASGTTAVITAFVVTPFDVVKTRLQAQEMPTSRVLAECCMADGAAGVRVPVPPPVDTTATLRFNGTWDAVLKISRHEGLRNLWRGLGSTVTMSVPNTAIYLTAYEHLKKYTNPGVAGAGGRFIACLVVAPLELVRTNMQAQSLSSQVRESSMSILRRYCVERGVLGLWRGIGPTLLRDVPFSALYWLGYEDLKERLVKATGPSADNYKMVIPFLAGASSGMLAAAVTTPFDVVKTRMQVYIEPEICLQPSLHGTGGACSKAATAPPASVNSTMAMGREILQREGLAAMFTGITPRVLKVAPACALVVGLYELAKSYFNSHR